MTIYLFGHIKQRTTYPTKVTVTGYRGKFDKILLWLKWSVLLSLFRRKEKKKLDSILKHINKYGLRLAQLKAYPVLWYRPDVVHIQWAKSLEEFMWVQGFGMKVVLSLRGGHINYSPLANPVLAASYQKNFPKVDSFHAVSEAIGKEAQKYAALPQKIRTIYSGLDLEQFEAYRKKSYESKSSFTILSVGRFHWKKGYHLALDALFELKKKGFNFNYQLIAGLPTEEILFQVHDLGLEEKVQFMPRMRFEEVLNAMQQADVLLLPSMEEGIANVVLEAMAIGLPVLSSDCGGMAEVIRHQENGWLFKSLDTGDLTVKLEQVLQSSAQERKYLAELACKQVEKNHQADDMIQQMIELYQTCA